MRQVTDMERIRILLAPDSEVSQQWLELYGEILTDTDMPSSLKTYFLRIDEQPMNRDYSTWYQELVFARDKLMRSVNNRFRSLLVEHFNKLDTYSESGRMSPKDGIEDRMLKQVLLDLIAVDDTEESHKMILDHFYSATTTTDRVSALMALNRSSSSSRRKILEEVYEKWHPHLSGYANYLRVVSSGTGEDVFEMIETEKMRRSFDINQPTWCRALFLPMAVNNKMVWTERGIRWVADSVIELAPINAITASRLLNTFQHVRNLKPQLKERVTVAVERILESVPEGVCPTVHGQAVNYLKG
jgi:aminopeptidase N